VHKTLSKKTEKAGKGEKGSGNRVALLGPFLNGDFEAGKIQHKGKEKRVVFDSVFLKGEEGFLGNREKTR